MNPDLAFILGAVLAEGYVSHKKREKCIGFCNTDQEFINVFKLSFNKVFPDCRLHEFRRGALSYGKKPFTALEIHSTYITEFLENLGLKKVPACKKQIPEIIFHSTKKSVAAFLRGFVEGDGSIYLPYYGRSPEIVFLSTSQKLLEEIQLLLLRFGLDSFLRFDKNRNLWRLFIRGNDNFVLFNKIGFVSEKKRKRLDKYCQINKDYRIMSKTDFIPFLSNYLRKKYKDKGKKRVFKNWIKGHNIDRYPKLRKYYTTLKQFLDQEDVELINYFLKQHYLFDEIISVRADQKEKVYSFRVDSKCHSFVSNGFISHNTEAKLSKIGEEALKDVEKNTVNFSANFDGTRNEPVVLPSPLPQLLLNGCLGIAVGMATNIAPNNLSEVCEAAIYLLVHPKANTEDLFEFIKGPDFPTGGIIFDKKAILAAYSQGKGSIKVRGKAEIVKAGGGFRIVISEIPYGVQKAKLIQQIAKLVQDKKIRGVRDIRDESDREGIRVVMDLKQGSQPRRALNFLYKWTLLQTSFHLNMVALVDGIQPKILSLADILQYFLIHRQEVIIRRTKFDLDRAKQRCHILEGFEKALKNIDAIIKTIRGSKDRAEAEKNLMTKFKLTKIQANAILDMKLASLAKMERQKVLDELKQTRAQIKELFSILKSPKKIKEIIKKELEDYKKEYGDERRTKIVARQMEEMSFEDLVQDEPAVITLTQKGFIKRVKPSVLRVQKRGGKGMIGQKTTGEDLVKHLVFARTHDKLLFFTDSGKVFQTMVFEVPEAKRVARGKSVLNFLDISTEEKVLALLALIKNEKDENQQTYFVMATKKGIIKKTAALEFENVRRTGLIAIKLKKQDLLKNVRKSRKDDEIMLVTRKGKAIRFLEKDIRTMGRQASGVRGIRLGKSDETIGMEIIKSKGKKEKEKQFLLVVSENGYGKMTPISQYRVQKRGGSGIKTTKITKKTGELVTAKILDGSEKHLIAISQKGHVIRMPMAGISKMGRDTQGVRVMRLEKGDRVASIAVI